MNNDLTNNRSGTLWIRIKNLKTPLQQIDNENYNNSDVMSVKQNADNVTWTFDDIALIDCRMPVPYQYSVLRQFDNDPDDDVVDPEHSLNMMVEDTSSDEEEIIDNANQSSTSSKTIGAIDTNPPDANAVIFNNANHNIHNNFHKFLLASFFLCFQPF